MKAIKATDENFTSEILQSAVAVVVEFSKPGKNEHGESNHSERTNDILDNLPDEKYLNQVKIVRVDLDACPKAAELFGVTAAPTLFYIQRVTEFRLKTWIMNRIDRMLEK